MKNFDLGAERRFASAERETHWEVRDTNLIGPLVREMCGMSFHCYGNGDRESLSVTSVRCSLEKYLPILPEKPGDKRSCRAGLSSTIRLVRMEGRAVVACSGRATVFVQEIRSRSNAQAAGDRTAGVSDAHTAVSSGDGAIGSARTVREVTASPG